MALGEATAHAFGPGWVRQRKFPLLGAPAITAATEAQVTESGRSETIIVRGKPTRELQKMPSDEIPVGAATIAPNQGAAATVGPAAGAATGAASADASVEPALAAAPAAGSAVPGGTAPPVSGSRFSRKQLAFAGGGIAAVAIIAVLAILLVGGGDSSDPTPVASPPSVEPTVDPDPAPAPAPVDPEPAATPAPEPEPSPEPEPAPEADPAPEPAPVADPQPEPALEADPPPEPAPDQSIDVSTPEGRLQSIVPRNIYERCVPVAPSAVASLGALDALECDLSVILRGTPPESLEIWLFPDDDTLTTAYETVRLATAPDRALASGRCNRVNWDGERDWSHGPDRLGGRLFCFFAEGDKATIIWYHIQRGQDDHENTMMIATQSNLTFKNLKQWWDFNSDEIGRLGCAGCP